MLKDLVYGAGANKRYHWFSPKLGGSEIISSLNSFYSNPPVTPGKDSYLFSNNKFNLYDLLDGINYIHVYAKTRGNDTARKTFPLLVDQYAPCDDKSYHSCNIEVINNATNQEVKLATNIGDLKLRISIIEGAGSGITTNGTVQYQSITT